MSSRGKMSRLSATAYLTVSIGHKADKVYYLFRLFAVCLLLSVQRAARFDDNCQKETLGGTPALWEVTVGG